MSIDDFVYRTKTYIAGDWTGDSDLIQKLDEWNKNNHLALSYVNVHEVTQSSDNSSNCNIKKSLRKRMSISKTFVLIVGNKTRSLRSGACSQCKSYNPGLPLINISAFCLKGYPIDNRSFVEYECEMALKDFNEGNLKNIVVIYNGLTAPDYNRCPSVLKGVGTHIGSDVIEDGVRKWAYPRIKKAICK